MGWAVQSRGNKAGMWVHHPDGDDVAVCPIELVGDRDKFSIVLSRDFVDRDAAERGTLGVGTDVFMVGRFISHEGKQRNLPSVRFGNIAQMPWEPITNGRGILQESFLVDMRSLSGYSGSPVFANTLLTLKRHLIRPQLQPSVQTGNIAEAGPWLLGIDWGHIPIYERILENDRETWISEKWWVRSNSGMAGVVPAWKILELLNQEELVAQRRLEEEAMQKKIESEPKAVFDAVFDAATVERVRTQKTGEGLDIPIPNEKQFFSDLTKITRKTDD